jgi:ribosome-interacting GTPase 1
MKSKYETAFVALIKELNDIINYNEQTIQEVLPDQRFIEALHYQIENSTIERVIDLIEDTLKDLSEEVTK